MKLAEWSVKRPVTACVIVLLMVFLGTVSFRGVPVDLFPDMNLPGVAIVTTYPGAGPLEVESQVTRTIEEAVGGVPSVEGIYSLSSEGSSLVTVLFGWGTNMDAVSLDLRERLDMFQGWLPSDASRPMLVKMDPSLMPVMQISASGARDLSELTYICEEVVKPRLERIEGVSAVSLLGSKAREIRVELDPQKLDGYGLSILQVAQAIKAENLNVPAGRVSDADRELIVRAIGEHSSAEDVGRISFPLPSGGRVEVRDLGRVIDGEAEQRETARLNGEPCLSLIIQKKSGANTVQVSARVRRALDDLSGGVPAGIRFDIAMDQAEFINLAIKDLAQSLLIGGILAVGVLFAFLRDVPSTVAIGLSIPVSVLATFLLLRFYGMTLNLISLGGLVLGVGMLVDNSIVVLENIYRLRQSGLSSEEAAISGTGQVSAAVTASTLTTVVVFLPVLFISGLASEIFSELALTVSFSLACSLLVALTFLPMLGSRLLAASVPAGASKRTLPRSRIARRILDGLGTMDLARIKARYVNVIQWSLKRRRRLIAGTVLAALCSFVPLALVGAEFLPEMASRELSVTVKMPRGTLLENTDEVVSRIEEAACSIPEVEDIFSVVGSTGGQMGFFEESSGDRGALTIGLGPGRPTKVIEEELRELVGEIPGAEISVDTSGSFLAVEEMVGNPLVVKIRGDDLEVLKSLSDSALSAIKSIPGIVNAKSSLEESKPEVRVVIEKDKAAVHGLSAAQVAATLRASLYGEAAGVVRQEGREIDVRVILGPEAREGLSDVRSLTFLSPLGERVSILEVATIAEGPGPVQVEREDQARVVQVSAGISGVSLSSATRAVKERLAGIGLPPGYEIEVGGQAEEMGEAFGDLYYALALAVILVYCVLAAQFQSWIHPVTIMVTLPLALVGSALLLGLTWTPVSVPVLIGAVTLAGVVVNNAIVLLDYVLQLRRQGYGRTEAIIEAGVTRLRPILMTTATTVLGLLPMALASGEGSQMNRPMALTVIGGLGVSTLLTLVMVPVVYTVFDDASERLGRFKIGRGSPGAARNQL